MHVTMADMVANVVVVLEKAPPEAGDLSIRRGVYSIHVHLIRTVAGVRDEWKIRSEYCDTC
jgi:hypothetical protein